MQEALSSYLFQSLFVSSKIIQIIHGPISYLGMTLVVFSIQTLDYYVPQDDQQNFIIYTPFHPKSDDS